MSKLKLDITKNAVVCGDCCNEQGQGWLNFIPDSSVDLIYIDPPFFSNKNYEIVWGNGYELRSFGDRFKGGINHYIDWMEPKIKEAKRVLKDTGSIFLHCDWHASHRLRCLLDDVFGEKNFRNEIICFGDLAKRPPEKYLQIDSQTVFWFSKSNKFKSMKEGMRKKTKVSFDEVKEKYKEYNNGKWGYDLPKGDYCEKTLKKKEKNGLAFKNSKGNWRVIKLLIKKEKHFIRDDKLGNIWSDLPRLDHLKSEKIGYKTQKTEALVKRILNIATKEGDNVLDFFGGGGTTAKVCKDLNRRFIIGDVSPVAIRVTADRLACHGYTDYEIKGLPSTQKEYLKMNPHQFADQMCEIMGWQTNTKKSGDGGIDGFANKGSIPIQIKNHSSKTGRPDIQKFLGAINKYEKGLFVSWGFSAEAWEFKAEIKDKELEFLEIGKLLNGLLISDNELLEHKKLYKERVKKDFKSSKNQVVHKQDIQKVREKSKRKRKVIKEEDIN